jgi:hypothetical protein
MMTIQKVTDWKFIFEDNNLTVRTMFNMWKIWLTKKEIADVYWIKKSEVKKIINEVILNSDIDLVDNIQKIYNKKLSKKETFYSLDILLLLWYKSKHYSETKFLVHTNKLIKAYTKTRKYRLNNFYSTWIVKSIFNYFDPVIRIVQN